MFLSCCDYSRQTFGWVVFLLVYFCLVDSWILLTLTSHVSKPSFAHWHVCCFSWDSNCLCLTEPACLSTDARVWSYFSVCLKFLVWTLEHSIQDLLSGHLSYLFNFIFDYCFTFILFFLPCFCNVRPRSTVMSLPSCFLVVLFGFVLLLLCSDDFLLSNSSSYRTRFHWTLCYILSCLYHSDSVFWEAIASYQCFFSKTFYIFLNSCFCVFPKKWIQENRVSL